MCFAIIADHHRTRTAALPIATHYALRDGEALLADGVDTRDNLNAILHSYLREKIILHRHNHSGDTLQRTRQSPQLLKQLRLAHIEIGLLGDVVGVAKGVEVGKARLYGRSDYQRHTTC